LLPNAAVARLKPAARDEVLYSFIALLAA